MYKTITGEHGRTKMAEYKVIESPLTTEERKKLTNETGELSIVIPVDLGDLIQWDIEELNDHACDMVGDNMFSDISFEVVGHIDNVIHIKISGIIDETEDEMNMEGQHDNISRNT